ncbi:MAG: phosphoenolpyruvate carboxykinase domain-containing protein, partial [Promethearchaeota archaeon]
EGWLAEHMFVMAVHGPEGRKTYITGAFPSGSGKTSTSMIPGGSIVGDDLAYIRNIAGVAKAVNVERGIFGIIRSVSAKDDPVIWEVLNSHEPAIFSNVLVSYEGIPYWLYDGRAAPNRGINYSGDWFEGKKDVNGEDIPLAHKNARYTIGLEGLSNVDKTLEDPDGVEIAAMVYGGRDPDTCVPVQESFDWVHGVITIGASLESESTAATLGPSGIRKFQPFSNMDFISIPLGRYIQNHLDFGESLEGRPRIYGVNYFLRDAEGNYLNGKEDKRVWLQWIDLRVHNEVQALKTPTGLIPLYEDLARLFRDNLNKEYTRNQYEQQFMARVPELLAKLERIENEYRQHVDDAPQLFYALLKEQKDRLVEARNMHGDYIPPSTFKTD